MKRRFTQQDWENEQRGAQLYEILRMTLDQIRELDPSYNINSALPLSAPLAHLNNEGQPSILYTSRGIFISQEYHVDFSHILNKANSLQAFILALVASAEGQRRTNQLKEVLGKLGEVVALYYAFLHRHNIPEALDPIQETLRRFNQLSAAVNNAIQGRWHELEQLAYDPDSSPYSIILDSLRDIETRGHRQTEDRTRILGEHTAAVHKKNQDWILTGRLVHQRLTGIAHLHDWIPDDLKMLDDALTDKNPKAVRNILEHPLQEYHKMQRVGRKPR